MYLSVRSIILIQWLSSRCFPTNMAAIQLDKRTSFESCNENVPAMLNYTELNNVGTTLSTIL